MAFPSVRLAEPRPDFLAECRCHRDHQRDSVHCGEQRDQTVEGQGWSDADFIHAMALVMARDEHQGNEGDDRDQ